MIDIEHTSIPHPHVGFMRISEVYPDRGHFGIIVGDSVKMAVEARYILTGSVEQPNNNFLGTPLLLTNIRQISLSAIDSSKKNQFEVEGSKTYYSPDISFSIDKMWLKIEPDFPSKTIRGIQQLKIAARQDLTKLEFDSAGLTIESVFYSSADIVLDQKNSLVENKKLGFSIEGEKLIVQLNQSYKEGSRFHLLINYVGKPERGFNFVKSRHGSSKQAWTQGEPTESKYWFPCLDHPQLKYPREISVIVPEDFIVISNGELNVVEREEIQGTKNIKYVWEELNPNPTYLTSIVIGQFAETSGGKNYDGIVSLRLYVPNDRVSDSDRSFKDTERMMRFFETYFSTRYPYDKYSQIVVDDFPYGGMENTSCTTLYSDILHDEKAHLDFNSDDVISHELAHQWFGDFITCRDWQHIWLNEGFATYCEALYVEHVYSTMKHEFQYYVLEMVNGYLAEAANLYKRPIVTKRYRDLDDLFDAHSYNKGGTVLHMLRHYVGEDDFKSSLRLYLDNFGNRTAESDDLRQIFEQVSGKSLQQFFDQWVFKKGHPELDINISLHDTNMLKIQVVQVQEEDAFVFPLEIKIITSSSKNDNEKSTLIKTIQVSERKTERIVEIPMVNSKIDWISVDSEFKVLKEIKSFNAPTDMILEQLENGETVYDKVQSIYALQTQSPEKIIEVLKNSVKRNFWGVAVESARILGSIRDSGNVSHSALLECLPSATNAKVRRAIVSALGNFQNVNDLDLLSRIVQDNDESYFVRYEAAVALGGHKQSISILERLVESNSFMQLVARGSLRGLLNIAINLQDKELVQKLRELFISKTVPEHYFRLRQTATSCLGSLARYFEDEREIVFEYLKRLLRDDWVHERNVACAALGNAFQYTQNSEVIKELNEVIQIDSDGQVVRTAIESIRMIHEEKPEEEKSQLLTAEKAELKPRSKKIEMLEKSIIQK